MFEPIEIKRSGDLVRFLREDDNGKKVKTVLLGNGFCLDHPTLKEVFIFNKLYLNQLMKQKKSL